MRVLTVVHDSLPAHVGGTEIHAHQLSLALAARGHALRVLTTERDLAAPEGDRRRRSLDGLEIHELVHQREYADVGDTWREPLALEALRVELGAWKPDVVHFHHLAFFGCGAPLAARALGAAVVITLHDYHLLCDAGTMLRRDGEPCAAAARPWSAPGETCADCLERHPLHAARRDLAAGRPAALAAAALERRRAAAAALAAADAVICPSRYLLERFCAAGILDRARAEVMRAGYPGIRHPPRPAPRGARLRVGYAGGIYPSKGVHVLVEALRLLRGKPVEIAIHGVLEWFPDYVARLRALAAELPVRFAGRFEPAEIDRVLADVDVLVVPSLWPENMPLTIQEAFRNGIPVVASELGGMAEAVRDGVDGLLFPRGDARALAACLARLADDRELLARLAAARPAVPAVEEIAASVEALYARALTGRAALHGADGLHGAHERAGARGKR